MQAIWALPQLRNALFYVTTTRNVSSQPSLCLIHVSFSFRDNITNEMRLLVTFFYNCWLSLCDKLFSTTLRNSFKYILHETRMRNSFSAVIWITNSYAIWVVPPVLHENWANTEITECCREQFNVFFDCVLKDSFNKPNSIMHFILEL